jgi:hypothetical protein
MAKRNAAIVFLEPPFYNLLALPPLMPCPGKKFSVLMLAHFLPTLLNYAAQEITSLLKTYKSAYYSKA